MSNGTAIAARRSVSPSMRALTDALEVGDYPRARTAIPPEAPEDAEALRNGIEALERENPEAACFELSGRWPPGRLGGALRDAVGRELLRAKNQTLAAAVWATGSPPQQARAAALLTNLRLEREDLPDRLRREGVVHWRTQIALDPLDAHPWERLALLLMELDSPEEALDAARRAWVLEPGRRAASRAAVRLLLRDHHIDEAIRWLEDAAHALPDAAWPRADLATVLEDHDVDAALKVGAAALDRSPDDYELLELCRRLLRKASLWMDLAEHIEHMIGSTLCTKHLTELHDELAHVLANRLDSPMEALEASRQAEFFRDPERAVASYWRQIGPDSQPPDWDEAEAFFRANERWDDLTTLLRQKCEMLGGAAILPVLDALEETSEHMVDGAQILAGHLQDEIARCEQPELREELVKRLESAERSPRTPRPRKPVRRPSRLWVVAAVGTAGAVVVFGAAGLLLLFSLR